VISVTVVTPRVVTPATTLNPFLNVARPTKDDIPLTFSVPEISTSLLISTYPPNVEIPGLVTLSASVTVIFDNVASSNIMSSPYKSPVILTSP
jgi:hypothetical protein